MKKIVILVIAVMLFSQVVFADEVVNNVVTIEKSFGASSANECFTLRVFKKDTDISSLPNKSFDEAAALLQQVMEATANADGLVKFTYPQNTVSGVYPYIITGESGTNTFSSNLYYTNAVVYDQVMRDLEAILDGTAADKNVQLQTLLSQNIDALQLTKDFPIFEGIKSGNTLGAYTMLTKTLNKNMTQEEMVKCFQQAMLINACERGVELLSVLGDYADILGMNSVAAGYYNKLLNKADAANRISGIPFDSLSDFLTAVHNAIAIASVNDGGTAPLWSSLITVLGDAMAYSGINTGRLYSQTTENQNTVIQKLISYRPFASDLDMAIKINTLIDGLSTSSGGGGGGGGGTISRTAYTPIASPNENKPEETLLYDDIASVSWAIPAIIALTNENIISGYGNNKFEPNNNIKREEFLKILVLSLKLNLVSTENPFSDVNSDGWYVPYVLTAKAHNITEGKGDGTFGIGENISRQDAAVMIARTLSLAEIDNPDNLFSDNALISEYARGYVYKLVDMGVINGVGDNNFAPIDPLTRAQAAKMIYELRG